MALKLNILSITSAYNSIVNFFKSQENNTRWRDLTTGSEGSFLIRLLANVFSAISYRIVGQSRETYLSTAALKDSNTAIAYNLQYSVFRGSNMKRRVQLIPDGSYTYPALSVVGQYSDEYDIINLNDVAMEEGEQLEFETVVGKVKTATLVADTSANKIFTFFTPNISEDFRLFLDDEEVPTTKKTKELIEDKYLVRTNPYLSIDILYLNDAENATHKYGTDSVFTVKYVELAKVEVNPYQTDMFNCGSLSSYALISNFKDFEDIEDIKINAPLQHELQNLIRSKADYAKRIRVEIPNLMQVNWEPLTPTYTQYTCLKDDLTMVSNEEEVGVKKVLKEENFFGTPLPDKVNPRRAVAKLNLDLALKDKYKNINDIKIDINNILTNFHSYELGGSFNTFDFERQIEELSYVRYARVSHVINNREPNSNYQVGYILENDGSYFRAEKILGQSGTSEPIWVVPQTQAEQNVKDIAPMREYVAEDGSLKSEYYLTQDGSLTWKCYKRLPNVQGISERQNNYNYGMNEFVISDSHPNYMFKCVDIKKSSGSSAPNLALYQLKDFILDGSLVWVVKEYTDAPSWSSFTTYSIGNTVNVNDSNLYSLECISYMGTISSTEDVVFSKDKYSISTFNSEYFYVSGDKRIYFRAGDTITAEYAGGYLNYAISESNYNSTSGLTQIKTTQLIDTSKNFTDLITVQRSTRDGQIMWTPVDNINNITYDWDSYVTYDYTLNIVRS